MNTERSNSTKKKTVFRTERSFSISLTRARLPDSKLVQQYFPSAPEAMTKCSVIVSSVVTETHRAHQAKGEVVLYAISSVARPRRVGTKIPRTQG